MQEILILVEGQTEERFVKDILNPFFGAQNIFLTPYIVNTKIVRDGPNYKGGLVSYTKVKRDLEKLLGDTHVIAVTTMFDFYGLPRDFPSWNNSGSYYEKVEAAEQAFAQDIKHLKLIPYLQLHEFEGLLFSSPKVISDAFGGTAQSKLEAIRRVVDSPEEINQGEQTHPSKRLLTLFSNYNKPIFGSIIAGRIGLDVIRSSCPHFNSWITKLLNLREKI